MRSVSHLFAYLGRMKFIRRWGLMHTTYPESVQEHSLRVAIIAHALATIRNRLYHGHVDAARTAVLALYHDASEVLTGDLPAPVKYHNPEIARVYHELEGVAAEQLLGMVPDALKADFAPLFVAEGADAESRELVKAADKIAAYVKCLEELAAGNQEFAKAEKTLRQSVESIDLPEVHYFVETFVSSFRLTLDDLG